jgi:hypothetical protein
VGPSENYLPYRDSNSDPSVVQPVLNRYTDCSTATRLKTKLGTKIVGSYIWPLETVLHYSCEQLVVLWNMDKNIPLWLTHITEIIWFHETLFKIP